MKRTLGNTAPSVHTPASVLLTLVYIGAAASGTLGLLPFSASSAWASELNGFRLESQSDGSLSVQVQADTLPAYDIEPSGNGVSILLKDTHLSDSLRQKGLPVVIDNRNRAIGRAVPGEGNTVKIIIPNWKPEQGALRIKADTGSSYSDSPKILPRPGIVAPSERLTGAFQSQFRSAAQALNKSSTNIMEETSISLPAVESLPSPRTSAAKSSNTRRNKKITYRPVVSQPTALPKVVNWNQPEAPAATPVATPMARSPYEASSLPLSAPTAPPRGAVPWPVVVQPAPTAKSTGWGSYGQTETENPYGIDSIADTVTPSATTSASMGSQLKQFFDNITGNRFSKPFGVAFWALMVGVIFIACLGFLALAIGLLCTRLVFIPFSGNASGKVSTTKSRASLFAWRHSAAEEDTIDEETPSVSAAPKLRGPVAKRFPFVASGLSQTASMYVPHTVGREHDEPMPKRSIRKRPQIIQPLSPPVEQRRTSDVLDTPTRPLGYSNPIATTAWRPHVATTPSPTSPAIIRQTLAPPLPIESRVGWSYPDDDRDLMASPQRPVVPPSPVERALYRLML
ncbi:MAG: hypothetical protein QE263_04770 [Vampirovibrionales bacterium]|nr:hypothetical protein [Vampirovibrionales bacterium]